MKVITLPMTLIAFILLGVSLPQMELSEGFYGLIHSFPFTYFMGLILLVLTFVVTLVYNPNRKLLGLQTLGLVTALWLIPTIIGSHPGLSLAYRSLQDIENITTQGLGILYWWYLSWPGFHALFSIITSWGINLENLPTTYPFLIQSVYAIPLYILLRNVLGKDREKYCWVGLWIFYLGNWTAQDYFGPQSLALLLLLAILAVVTHKSLWEGPTRIKLTMTFILVTVFSYLIVTHLLTSLVAICMLSAYALVRKSPRLAITVVVCVILTLGWDVSFGGHYVYSLYGEPYGQRLLERNIPIIEPETPTIPAEETTEEPPPETPETPVAGSVVGERGTGEGKSILTFNPESIIQRGILYSLRGSDSHIAVVRVRIAYSSVFAVMGFLGAIFMLVRRRNQTNIAILAMAISLGLLVPLRYAGWELLTRLYMLELPLVACLGVIAPDTNKRKVVMAIGLSLLFTIGSMGFLVCHYGNHTIDHWSQDCTNGYKFVQDLRADPNNRFVYLYHIQWEKDYISLKTILSKEPHYFAIGKHDDKTYTYLYNNPDFVDHVWEWLRNNPSYISIYNNPEFEVFEWVQR